MKTLAKYQNGNYNVILLEDGTKIRFNDLDNLTPSFPESMDLCISMKCNGGMGNNLCEFCYANCTPKGKHANLNHPILDTLHPGMELAINGNDLSHPDLENFLIRMKEKGVFTNMTINQKHLYLIDKVKDWQDRGLLYGIGISLTDSTDEKLYKAAETLKNVVIHTIDGLLTKEDLDRMSNKNLTILVLGYKKIGRGDRYYLDNKDTIESNIEYLKNNLLSYRNKFRAISFDNLALEHLDIQSQLPKEVWKQFYMGDEGSYTMYVDIVNEKFAKSSLETEQYELLDSIDEMFNFVRSLR